MSVYRLICSDTNRVYYGKTKNSLEHRLSKGHYNCVCKDFVKPTIHLVETCELKDLADRELYYINNFECINISGKGNETPNRTLYKKNKSKQKRWCDKVRNQKRHYCSLCKVAYPTNLRLERHCLGQHHTLKQKSYEKYGENWVHYYIDDDTKRHRKNEKKNISTFPEVLNCPVVL